MWLIMINSFPELIEILFYCYFSVSESCRHRNWENFLKKSFPVAQLVEHGVSNAKIMGSIPRESKIW